MNNYILIGNEIDKKEISRLIAEDEIYTSKVELINKLSKKKLSKRECINFLSSSNLKDQIVNKIVSDLEKTYFINDSELAEAIIVSGLVNKKGREKIKEVMKTRLLEGNYDKYIDDYLDVDRYNKNIIYLIDKYQKLGNKNSGKVLRQYIANKMILNGYNYEEFESYLIIEERDEIEIASKEIVKYFKIREVNNENIAKITKKLLSKGFNYDIIKCAIERSVYFETN